MMRAPMTPLVRRFAAASVVREASLRMGIRLRP